MPLPIALASMLPLPLLTAHTNLFYNSPPSPTLLAHEPLQYCPSGHPRSSRPLLERVVSDREVNLASDNATSLPPLRNALFLPESDLDESFESEDKIEKPEGEVGRPGRGGYNLEKTLDWDRQSFAKLKKCVHRLVDKHLDTGKSVAKQSLALLRLVCDSATEIFPRLEEYKGAWPAMDLIKMRLKYTSVRSRRREEKMALGRTRRDSRVE